MFTIPETKLINEKEWTLPFYIKNYCHKPIHFRPRARYSCAWSQSTQFRNLTAPCTPKNLSDYNAVMHARLKFIQHLASTNTALLIEFFSNLGRKNERGLTTIRRQDRHSRSSAPKYYGVPTSVSTTCYTGASVPGSWNLGALSTTFWGIRLLCRFRRLWAFDLS